MILITYILANLLDSVLLMQTIIFNNILKIK